MVDIPTEDFSSELPLPGFNVRMLTQDGAPATYRSGIRIGEDFLVANRCSVWRRSRDGWLLEFHQGTPVELRGNSKT